MMNDSQNPSAAAPARESYQPGHFVGRGKELDIIKEKVRSGLDGAPIPKSVIHIWGPPGIGKSWLLQHLAHEYNSGPQDQIGPSPKKCGTLAAQVDFRDLELSQKNPLSIAQVVAGIFDQLQRPDPNGSLPEETKAFQAKYEQFKQSPNGAGEIPGLLECFLEYVKWLTECYVPLLLFDGVEKLPSDDFFWLEREIIAPLARTDRVLFVIASRKELPRWKEFSVRQRLEVWELQGFDLQTTQEQLTRYALPEEAAREIYPYTFGYPYANQILGAAWQEGKPSAEKIPIFLSQIEKELLENAVLERERDILRALSTLRRFNVESARRFLKQAVDPEFGALSDGYYLRLFEMLEQAGLVFWNSEQRGYVCSREVRGILQSRLRLAEPERYQELHQHALEMYQQWIEHYQGQEERFFPEMLYHCIQQYCGDATVLRREVIALLERWLTPDHFNGEQLDSLYHLIAADPELEAALPPALYEKILTRIEQQKNEPMKEATSCSS